MSKLDKALARLSSRPSDYHWSELVALLTALGYHLEQGNGSRRNFIRTKGKLPLSLHEPHPNGILKAYAVKQVMEYLKQEGVLHA